jgi:hyperosmotically inducible protein
MSAELNLRRILRCLLLSGCVVVAPVWLTAGCAGDRYHRSTGEYLDDKSLSTRVKAALLADKVVSGLDVKVQTYEGVVQLSGFVDTPAQQQRAAEIARTVHGVREVRNDLIAKAP